MKTQASLETFFEQIRIGKLKNDKQIVYSAILKNPGITLMDLKRKLKMSHQTVSARLSDLLDVGIVEIVGTQKRIGNVSVSSDSILKAQEDYSLIQQNKLKRLELRFKRAVKTVLSFGSHLDEETKNNLLKLIK